jgi:CheY-like chemotaxis protein
VAAGINGDAAAETAQLTRRTGGEARAHAVDVAVRAQVAALVTETVERYGGIDVMVSNAGIGRNAPVLEVAEGALDRVLDVNLKGIFWCGHLAGRAMVHAGRGGVIINTASTYAEVTRAGTCTSLHVLPFVNGHESCSSEPTEAEKGAWLAVCIVVVEDDADIRSFVTHVLEDEGYRVVSFGHPVPVTALHKTNELPRLFIIDIMLPDMDGIALARRLGSTVFAATPKVAMSASEQALSQARRSNQFDAHLAKPFDVDDLLDCVERHTAG